MKRAKSVDDYIADAKREEIKQRRLEKILPLVAVG